MLRHDGRAQLRDVGMATEATGARRHDRPAKLLRPARRREVLSQPRAAQSNQVPGDPAQS